MSADDFFANLFGGGGGGGGHAGFDFGDGGYGFFSGAGSGMPPRGPRKGESIKYPLSVSLEDFYNGKKTKLALEKNVICVTCQGKGGKTGATKKCTSCKGRGFQIITRQVGMGMLQQMQVACAECHSTGEIVKDRCKKCKGKKVVEEKKYLDVFIEKGMVDGQKIVMKGEADQEPGMEPGDVNLILNQKEHAVFERKGADLLCHVTISLQEALCGFDKVLVTHLDGRGIQVKHPKGKIIQPKMVKRVPHEGMPIYKRQDDHGDLYIQFDVAFPKDDCMTLDEFSTLQALLSKIPNDPTSSSSASLKKHDIIDECSLIPGELASFGANQQTRNAYDDDSEDEQAGAGINCAQQ
ncbi:unnamed protein product [Cunninghamella echinulata]